MRKGYKVATIAILLGLALLSGLSLFAPSKKAAAHTASVPSLNILPSRIVHAPTTYSATTLLTVGNEAYEVSSATLLATTTCVAAWCTGENAIVNWWSTAKTDLGTTNGYFLLKDSATVLLDRFQMGAGNTTTFWAASRSATSATVVIIEFARTD